MKIASLISSLTATAVVLSSSSSVVSANPAATLRKPSFAAPKAAAQKVLNKVEAAVPTKAVTASTKSPLRAISKDGAVWMGILLAGFSGFSNGAFMSGFVQLIPKQGVAAVTGAWTNSAVGFASNNMKMFWSQTSIILSFIGGSMIYGLMNPNPELFQVNKNVISNALALVSACFMGAIWILDHAGKNDRAAAFEACCLAAVASGIQNSLTSAHTGNLCRTTHYTGISSDMGTFLGQVLRGNKANLFKLQTFVKLALSFWVGGAAGYLVCQKYHADAILVPAVLNMILAVFTRFS